MIAIEKRVSGLDLGKEPDEIYNDAMFELTMTDPAKVEAELADEG